MAILSDRSIRQLHQAGTLGLDPFHEDGLQPASYDMRLHWKILVSPTRFERGRVIDLRAEPGLKVEPGRFVGVLTEEILGMPPDIAARFGLRSEFTRHGLVAFGGIQIDPGFKGRLAISLFNAGPEPIEMEAGRKMFTVEFQRLDVPAEKPYQGEYQSLTDFAEDQQNFILNAHTVSMAEIALVPSQMAKLEVRLERIERTAEKANGPASVALLAEEQGVSPTLDLREFEGGWPDDEDLDEFLNARSRAKT